MQEYYIYILSNIKKSLYIWVTNNLERRVYEHKNKTIKWFTEKYNINKLVYYEKFDKINDAISCEKKLKNWHKIWKHNLIEENNPNWLDLSKDWN